MNSSRMPPGAATKAIRRLPNAPSTTAGPHNTSWPRSSAHDDRATSQIQSLGAAPATAICVPSGEYRANGPVSNLDAFYAAFSVNPGDKMYRDPEHRVRIW